MKLRLISLIIFIFSFSAGAHVFAQTCTNDPDDPGNCDTLWIEQENGRISPNTSVVRHIWAYHDEVLSGWTIPIKYKNPQTDVTLDSVILTAGPGYTIDTIIDRNSGTIIMWPYSIGGFMIPAGTDTFAILYFRTGPTWDPATHNPLDTFTIGGPGGQGLSFVDTAGNDIQPVYNPPGNLDVGDGHKGQSARPKSLFLYQNYPNPFNNSTQIKYSLPQDAHVQIVIYNILGQKIKNFDLGYQTAGYKSVFWDGKDNSGNQIASGIYFYRIVAGDFSQIKKMTLLK